MSLSLHARFMLGMTNGTTVACKPLVSEVCGKEHATVGMGVLTSEKVVNARCLCVD